MGTNPSGGNQARRAGMTFLRNTFALFALLLAAANPAWAKTIFVDTGGNDAFNGESATNQGGGVGPVQTIFRALQLAVAGDVISIEAGTYAESVSITTNSLSFVARPDPVSNFSVVRILGNITNAATGTVFGATEAGTFAMEAPGNTLTLTSGSFTATAGKFTLPSGVTINRVNGSASGQFTFLGTVTVNYTGSANVTTGAELPASIGNSATINVALTGGTLASPRTLTLTPGTVTFGTNGVLNIAAFNVVTGSFVFGTGAAATINGSVAGNITATSGAAIAVMAGGSVTGTISATTGANITVAGTAGNVTLTSGTLSVSGTVTGTTTVNGTVVISGGGNVGNLVIPAGGTADFDSNITAVNVDINGGTLQFDGNTLTVQGNFNRTSGTIATIGNLTFLGGTSAVTFAAGPNFVVQDLTIGGGTVATAKTVNFTQDVQVNGNFNLTANSTAQLNERTITFASAGTFTDNGMILSSNGTTGGVVFTVNGATLTGTGTISNIDVVTGGAGITVASAADITFTGTLSLTNGGIVIAAGGDLSAVNPANNGGNFARVLINVADANTQITGDPFNKDNQDYDLTYTNAIARGTVSGVGGGTRVVGQEFDTNDFRNLLVDVRGGTVDASARPGGTIAGTVTVRTGDNPATAAVETSVTVLFPNAPTIVLGAVTVEEDATLSTTSSIELRAATNTVAGTLGGAGTILLANGVTVTGDAAAALGAGDYDVTTTRTQQASLGNVATVANASATITNLRQILGTVTTAAGSSLSVGLVGDGGPTATGRNAGNINGAVALGGSNFTLTTNVEFIDGTFNVNTGTLTLGTNNLVIFNAANPTVTLANVASVGVSASTGRIIFASTGTLSANGKTVPNLSIWDDVQVPTNLVVSTSFIQSAAGAELQGAGNVTLSGTASFTGGAAISGTGVNTLTGLAISMTGNTTFVSAVVAGDVSLASSGTGSPFDLTVSGLLRQTGGALALGTSDIILTGAGLAYDHDAGTITSATNNTGNGGALWFQGGAAQTYDLGSDLVIPFLIVDNAAGVSETLGTGTNRTLTISQRIELRNGSFDAEANAAAPAVNGDLVFGANVTVVRWNGFLAAGDTPTFSDAATLNYEYGDRAPGALTTVNPIVTANELASQAATFSVFDPTRLDRTVTVNNTFRLASTLDASSLDATGFGTGTDRAVLTLATGGRFILEDVGRITPVGAGNEVVTTTYTLQYLNYRLDATGTSVADPAVAVATVNEFPATAGVVAALIITQTGANGSPRTLQLPTGFNRQVSSLTVESGRLDINGNRFSVTGNTDLSGGLTMVMNLGGVNTTVSTAIASSVAGARLAFEGTADADLIVGSTGGSRGFVVPVNINIELNKGTETTKVTLVGGFLDFAANSDPLNAGGDRLLYLTRGILVAGMPADRSTIYVKLVHNSQNSQNINLPDRGQGFVIANENPPGREAYVSGNVIKEFSNNPNGTAGPGAFIAGRVVYPVGDRTGNYSPITLDFESNANAAAQSFSTRRVTVNFVDTRPSGSLGFPIANGAGTGQNVTNYANFYWFISSDPALGSGTQFNVEARAEGYRLLPGENIQTLRLVRRETGDENLNPFTLVGTSGSYQNYLVDPTPADNTNNDEIPVVLVQGASAFLSPAGSIFTFGNQRGEVNPPPPPVVNVAQLQVAHLAPTGGSPVDVYVNGVLFADNLSYLNATGYQQVNNVNGTANLAVAIAPSTSTSAAQAVRTVTVAVAQGQSYFVGIVDDGADATAGNVVDVVTRQAGMTSSQSGRTELFAVNAVANIGAAVDFRAVSGLAPLVTIFRNVAFGATSGTEVIDPATYELDVVRTGTSTRLDARRLNLQATAGQRGVLAFVGTATDNPLSPSRNRQLIFISPTGQVITGQSIVGTDDVALPTEFALKGAFPNPFSSRAAVRFDLPTAGEVSLVVVDLMGREVLRVPATAVAAGANQRIELDGQNMAAGMYLYRLTAVTAQGTKVASGQITLVK